MEKSRSIDDARFAIDRAKWVDPSIAPSRATVRVAEADARHGATRRCDDDDARARRRRRRWRWRWRRRRARGRWRRTR
jgi:hypothetical protein